jgi:hypothetical protein
MLAVVWVVSVAAASRQRLLVHSMATLVPTRGRYGFPVSSVDAML